ncbi:hypothetical protein FSARC_585 [Fusarium sarcochroum]|uniref:Uncharacterized protein n=1 Tax=Fusarium sarcochroum TaxID=1208366 RepID=A0A8H4XFB1_9HYPO|nr:hypothetical protein FSARC_585 [Fusarium sarcochroum]
MSKGHNHGNGCHDGPGASCDRPRPPSSAASISSLSSIGVLESRLGRYREEEDRKMLDNEIPAQDSYPDSDLNVAEAASDLRYRKPHECQRYERRSSLAVTDQNGMTRHGGNKINNLGRENLAGEGEMLSSAIDLAVAPGQQLHLEEKTVRGGNHTVDVAAAVLFLRGIPTQLLANELSSRNQDSGPKSGRASRALTRLKETPTTSTISDGGTLERTDCERSLVSPYKHKYITRAAYLSELKQWLHISGGKGAGGRKSASKRLDTLVASWLPGEVDHCMLNGGHAADGGAPPELPGGQKTNPDRPQNDALALNHDETEKEGACTVTPFGDRKRKRTTLPSSPMKCARVPRVA